MNWIISKRYGTIIALEIAELQNPLRLNVLYFNPATARATDYKFPLAGENLDQALRFCVYQWLIAQKTFCH